MDLQWLHPRKKIPAGLTKVRRPLQSLSMVATDITTPTVYPAIINTFRFPSAHSHLLSFTMTLQPVQTRKMKRGCGYPAVVKLRGKGKGNIFKKQKIILHEMNILVKTTNTFGGYKTKCF